MKGNSMRTKGHWLTTALVFTLSLGGLSLQACTIFVLTDTNRVLFCNNEDGPNLQTRIWFVPSGTNRYGAVYVGYDNGWAQGGLNSEGLAFDWVAGYKEEWKAEPSLPPILRNEQVLETCATVEQAIAFYRTHHETSFNYAKIMLADRTGASVIVGSKDGQLQVEKSNRCRGFGYGARTLDKLLNSAPEPTVANGAKILRACVQEGQYATRYFNIFDLKAGDIFLFPSPATNSEVKLNLAAELKKGGHYYDIGQIRDQLAQAPQPLLPNMERLLLEKYHPIPDQEPKVTEHVRAMLQDALKAASREEDFTADAWKEVSAKQQETRVAIQAMGKFVSLTLVDRQEEGGKRIYRYRVEFEKNTVLQRIVFDEQNKLAVSDTEDIR